MNTPQSSPDPVGLGIAREIQERVRSAEIILNGSRAAGDHRPDSDVDLMAVAPDEDTAERTKEILRQLLEGKDGVPVVNVVTITQEEFGRTALLGQSFAGQAARHGVAPDGRSLDYRPERDPTAAEIRELTTWWLRMAERHLSTLKYFLESPHLYDSELLGTEAQWELERAFKGLLAADNDPTRFKRDAALMWRHVESAHPIADREGAEAMQSLLAATTGPTGLGCSLTALSEAYRRHEPAPELSEPEWEAVRTCVPQAVDALIREALARSGAAREELRRQRGGHQDTG